MASAPFCRRACLPDWSKPSPRVSRAAYHRRYPYFTAVLSARSALKQKQTSATSTHRVNTSPWPGQTATVPAVKRRCRVLISFVGRLKVSTVSTRREARVWPTAPIRTDRVPSGTVIKTGRSRWRRVALSPRAFF